MASGTFWAVLVGVIAILIAVPLSFPTTVFDPKVLHQIAKDAIDQGGLNHTAVVYKTIAGMKARYPDHIKEAPKWVFNNAGGAMGSMLILHASFSEYIIIFGSAIGTEGHTGRFLADDWFHILTGEQWAFEPGAIHKEVYKPGSQHHLKWGVAKGYKFPDECWALEYARGNIVAMLPFGYFDTLFSTIDFITLWDTT
eukprot:CAMPEP_0174918890 /NCGR_PEP_ID=MMETSP1355-20121228/3354_1 /TAXON_ID=464990 /ORGANISM="Hemiselmis tepida, Strain CCMP443" /LENGTH=196 /DNA_ID=CAMNT_0016164093 /DNA_START=8 /DNA_END=594 /DNA_ORIENTATION=+